MLTVNWFFPFLKLGILFLFLKNLDKWTSEYANTNNLMNFLSHQLLMILRISYENMNRKSSKSRQRMGLMLMLQQLQLLATRQLLRLVHLLLSSSKSHKLRRFHIDIACQRMRSTLPQYQRHVTKLTKYSQNEKKKPIFVYNFFREKARFF